MLGLRPRHRAARGARPGQPDRDAAGAVRFRDPRRPAGHDRARDRLPDRLGAAARRPDGRRRRSRARCSAVNTSGAILGSLLVPFVLMPTIGSPAIIVLLAADERGHRPGLALIARPTLRSRPRWVPSRSSSGSCDRGQPARPRRPAERGADRGSGRHRLRLDRGRDRLGPGRPGLRRRRNSGSPGTSMTLLTVDAKLMPILPLIARPESKRALVVAFGMGTAFRAALIAGLQADAVELVPSVPEMFGYYYPDADDGPRGPGRARRSSPTAGTTSSSRPSSSTSSSPTRRRRSRARARR